MEFVIIGCVFAWLALAWKKKWIPGMRHDLTRRAPAPEIDSKWTDRQHNDIDGLKCEMRESDLVRITSPAFPDETVATLCKACMAQLPADVWSEYMARELAKFEAEQMSQAERDAVKRSLEARENALRGTSTEVLEAQAKAYAAQLAVLRWDERSTERQEITNKSLVVTKELDRRRREAKAPPKDFNAADYFINVTPNFSRVAAQAEVDVAATFGIPAEVVWDRTRDCLREDSARSVRQIAEHQEVRAYGSKYPTRKSAPTTNYLLKGYSYARELQWDMPFSYTTWVDGHISQEMVLGSPGLARETLHFVDLQAYERWLAS